MPCISAHKTMHLKMKLTNKLFVKTATCHDGIRCSTT